MAEHLIKTIHKVRVTSGKWTEFWFKEDLKKAESHHAEIEIFSIQEGFHACMKTYMFLDVLEKEGIYSDVLTDGFKNRKTVWKMSEHGTHHEFVGMLKDTRIVLIEKIK
jgi:hypothetical protein